MKTSSIGDVAFSSVVKSMTFFLQDMFAVYSATVPQLKAICSALPECEGFNSQGWVKSRVVNKKRAAIDLYLKQTAIITPQPGEVCHILKPYLTPFHTTIVPNPPQHGSHLGLVWVPLQLQFPTMGFRYIYLISGVCHLGTNQVEQKYFPACMTSTCYLWVHVYPYPWQPGTAPDTPIFAPKSLMIWNPQ